MLVHVLRNALVPIITLWDPPPVEMFYWIVDRGKCIHSRVWAGIMRCRSGLPGIDRRGQVIYTASIVLSMCWSDLR